MTRVLVTGPDRPIGKAILPRLVKHGMTPVAGVGDMAGPVMSIDHDLIADGHVGVDLDTHSSVRAALQNVGAVIHAADVRPGGSHDIAESMRALASACVEVDAHLVFISRVGADISSLSHRKQLWKAEQVVEQTDGLAYTIQRVTHTHPSVQKLLKRPWLPFLPGTPIQPVAPDDVAGRVVGLVQVGSSQRVRDYGGPELMRFADVAHVYKQERGTIARKVPLPKVGLVGEALAGVHVTKTGDRGTQTFREWLQATA